MHILSLILETDINSNKNIIEKIILLKEKAKKCYLLNKLILLLNDFEFNESIIKNALEKSKEDLEHTSSLKKLFEIDIKIKELNLDILNPRKNKNSLTVLDKMYERPEFINFFKNKTIYDIRQMNDLIDDSEDVFITAADIDNLEACLKFIEKLKIFCSSEKKFLNQFINLVEKNK